MSDGKYIAPEFFNVLAKYIPPNIQTPEGVTANPEFNEALYALWFAATGQTFQGAQ